jgi:hypothetical protein
MEPNHSLKQSTQTFEKRRTFALVSRVYAVSTGDRNKICFGGSRALPVREAENRTAICELIVWAVGHSASHNPIGLHGLLRG